MLLRMISHLMPPIPQLHLLSSVTLSLVTPCFFFLFFVFCLTDFLPSLKSLFGNPVYFLYLCASTIQFNSLFGMVTYKPKYIEQQYGQSSSKANFVIGMLISPSCFPIGTINHVLWILSHFREIVPIFRLKVMYGTSKSEWEKKKKNLAG